MSLSIPLDLSALLNSLPDDKRSDVYDWFSLEDAVIENVVTMIVEGATKSGSWRGEPVGISKSLYPNPIDTARRYIATHAEQLTKDRCIELQTRLDQLATAYKALEQTNVDLSVKVHTYER